MVDISVSILNMDFKDLANSIKKIEETPIDSFHMDIMDGQFVNNISFGPDVVKAVSEVTGKPFYSHLMIFNPERFVDRFFEAGSESVVVHVETLNKENKSIMDRPNMGISLNPDIPLEDLFPYLDKVDRVLVMSVYAGFGGQKFIPESLDRISELARRRKEQGLDFIISVDGGINYESAVECVKAGVDEISVGSYITKSEDPAEAIRLLKSINE
jgi:ribulose-phosphate 3-epimerase